MAPQQETSQDKLAVDYVHVVAHEGHWLREVVDQMGARGWRASLADAEQTLPRGEHPLVIVWLDDDTMLWPSDLEMFCYDVLRERPMACVLLAANRPSRDVARAAIALNAPIAFRDELKMYIDLHFTPVPQHPEPRTRAHVLPS
jgi:hypothetical protein